MWNELYENLFPELLRFAQGRVHDAQIAEDAVQETFLRALQNADTMEDLSRSQRRAWLYRTLKNLIADHYRSTSRVQQYAQFLEDDAVSEEKGFASAENESLLALLDYDERVLFQMRYFEDYNAAELAQIFHMPPGTVRSKLARSRKKLKDALLQDSSQHFGGADRYLK